MEPTVQTSRFTDPPIFRLPVEILSKIFLLLCTSKATAAEMWQEATNVAPLPAPHRTAWQNETEAPPWTDVLYVCQRWQTVGLNFPALWTQLTHNPAWAIECICRSRQMPLDLSIEQTASNHCNAMMALQAILPHFFRMKEVQIVADYHDFMAYVLWCFEMTPAPCLQKLSLECTGCLQISDPRICYQLEHPEALFAQHTPNLHTVNLVHHCCLQIPPSAPLFYSLTHLEVSDPRLWKYVSVEHFISCIANWTRLQTLVLLAALPYMAGASGVRPPYPMPVPACRIALPHLRQIRIVGDSATCVDHFLRHLILPPYVLLHLDCELFDENVDWNIHDVDPAVVALSLLENVPATTTRLMDNLRIFLNKDLLQVIGYMYTSDDTLNNLDEDAEGDHAQTRARLDAFMAADPYPEDEDSFQHVPPLHLVLRENRNPNAPPGGANVTFAESPFDYFGCILGRLSFVRANDIVSLQIDQHFSKETWLQVLNPMCRLEYLRFRCVRVGRDGASLLHGFIEAFAGDVPRVHDPACMAATKAEAEPEPHYGEEEFGSRPHLMHGLLLPCLRILDVDTANFGPAIWQRLITILRHRIDAGTRLQVLIARGEEGSQYRPDEQTCKELDEDLRVKVIWQLIDYASACCECCRIMEGERDEEKWEENVNEGEDE